MLMHAWVSYHVILLHTRRNVASALVTHACVTARMCNLWPALSSDPVQGCGDGMRLARARLGLGLSLRMRC
jgi:hypothetical protein